MSMGLCRGNKFRLLKPGVLAHWCQGCGVEHAVDIHALSQNGNVIGWDGTFDRPTFAQPVRHETPYGRCEYELRGGMLIFSPDCWHPLAGKVRTLEELHT